jgi:heptosyltransferase-3
MIKRILIIRPDKIGDLILTLPMARVIKESLPDAHVSFLVGEYTAPLARLCPDIDEVILYDRNWSLGKTVSVLRYAKPDALFVFGHKLKLTIASFIAGIPIRVGRAYFWFSFLYNKKIFEHRKTAERNEAEFNTRMLAAIGINAEKTPLPQLDKNKLPKNPITINDYMVFHIPTGGSAPHWDEDHFVELGQKLTQKYSYPIILTGLPSDTEYLLRVSERMKHTGADVHIHTESKLLELASVLASARIVISGSTGPGHIAAALGVPVIGLFPGVTALSKERWGFRGKRAVNLSPLHLPKKECPECKDCICINKITATQVEEAIAGLTI